MSSKYTDLTQEDVQQDNVHNDHQAKDEIIILDDEMENDEQNKNKERDNSIKQIIEIDSVENDIDTPMEKVCVNIVDSNSKPECIEVDNYNDNVEEVNKRNYKTKTFSDKVENLLNVSYLIINRMKCKKLML